MSFKIVKLGEICEIKSGGTPSRNKIEYWKDGKIPWVKIGDIKGKYVTKTDEFITEDGLNNSSAKLFKKGTILYTIFATLGEVAILDLEAATNQAIVGITHDNSINTNYLYYFLKGQKNNVINIGRGVAQSNINLSILKEMEIILPSIKVQQKIAEILDKAQELIDKRKAQIEALDELVKSRFLEMFGDPVLNPKGWEKVICKDITSKIGSGATPKGGNSSYKEEGIPLIRSMNVHNNKFIKKDLAFIDEEQAQKLNNVIVEKEDVLLNITGASVARSCIVPNELIPARVNQHVAIIRCKKESILPTFMVYQFTNDSYQRLLWDIATSGGATREAITKQQIEKLELIVPPLNLQTQFADFVNHINKLKSEMERSLKELEDNFNSLMQKAFKGELFS